MWRRLLAVVFILILGVSTYAPFGMDDAPDLPVKKDGPGDPVEEEPNKEAVVRSLSTQGTYFTENLGQLGAGAGLYYCLGDPLSVAFGTGWVGYDLRSQDGEMGVLFRIIFNGANPVEPTGTDPLAHQNNYFQGSDPNQWVTGARNFGEVVYANLYDGTDLRFYFQNGMLKYDFIIRPGYDVSQIRMSYEGIEDLELDQDTGDLIIRTSAGLVRDKAPLSYSRMSGVLTEVASNYILVDDYHVGFEVRGHRPGSTLVIDPGMIFSTFFGGDKSDSVDGVALDTLGKLYITGISGSSDFRTTPGAYRRVNDLGNEVFVTKMNANATSLIYSTFISSGRPTDMCVDDEGNAIVLGTTYHNQFPTTQNAYNRTHGGGGRDIFLLKLNATGSKLLYSTFLGGSDDEWTHSVALDDKGRPYVIGYTHSDDFPTTVGAVDRTYNGEGDGFISVLSKDASSLDYSTYIGGTDIDTGNGIQIDDNGEIYGVGWTTSADFPTTVGAYDTTINGLGDTYLVKLNMSSTSLLYSTYIGGSKEDVGYSLELFGTDSVAIIGHTDSANFPTTSLAYDPSFNGGSTHNMDGFALSFDISTSSLEYSTYWGGGGDEVNPFTCTNGNGSVFITARTDSTSFPVTPYSFDTTHNGGDDAFLLQLDRNGSYAQYSTYIGGSDGDRGLNIAYAGNNTVYVVGITTSSDYPTTQGAYDSTYNGGVGYYDGFIFSLQTKEMEGTIPSEPQNVSATSDDKAISVTWDLPLDDGGLPVLGYIIYRGPSEDNLTRFFELSRMGTQYHNRLLTNGVTYYYAVSAVNGFGEGNRSMVVNATPHGLPGPPVDINVTAGCGSIHVIWSPPTDTGGLPVLGYIVLRGNTPASLEYLVDLGNVTEVTDEGLSLS
jgi:hypothetical protein